MLSNNQDILLQLQQAILPLQGFKPPSPGAAVDLGLGPLKEAFPNGAFPTGVMHDFISTSTEDATVSGGFIAGLLGRLMHHHGPVMWIGTSRTIFPPALKAFGMEPDQVIFVDLRREKDVLWAMEEALKCEGLAGVVGELQDLSFTASRRLQLAVEQSRVTGFLLRQRPRQLDSVACVARWKITSVASELEEGKPGVGFPRWKVELVKVRNGRPGSWQFEWSEGKFRHLVPSASSMPQEWRRKTG